jgi:peptidoglycan/xylan/chitin deacetylase (PgdA/CDA1 family)
MTVYVAAGFIDRSADYWWGALERIVLHNERIPISKNGVSSVYMSRTLSEKAAAFDALTAQAHADMDGFLPVLEDLFRNYNVKPLDVLDQDALSIEQARKLAADPLVKIGAHGLTHRPLSHLSAEEAGREIIEGRTKLQDWLEAEIDHFAYPYGSARECGAREFALVRDAGFKTATTTRNGNIFAAHRHHPCSLPRVAVSDEWKTSRVVRFQLSGAVSALRNGFSPVF